MGACVRECERTFVVLEVGILQGPVELRLSVEQLRSGLLSLLNQLRLRCLRASDLVGLVDAFLSREHHVVPQSAEGTARWL